MRAIVLSTGPLFYYYHYHHHYHYSYHNFIITILCYAPSVITCTVGGAIQMTVYIYIHVLKFCCILLCVHHVTYIKTSQAIFLTHFTLYTLQIFPHLLPDRFRNHRLFQTFFQVGVGGHPVYNPRIRRRLGHCTWAK